MIVMGEVWTSESENRADLTVLDGVTEGGEPAVVVAVRNERAVLTPEQANELGIRLLSNYTVMRWRSGR